MHAAEVPALRISSEVDGDMTLVRLAGELDLATADQLREQVRSIVAAGSGVRRLVIDLAGLEFLDVTGLGTLLEAGRRMSEKGGTLVLRQPRRMVVRMLSLLSLDDALQVED